MGRLHRIGIGILVLLLMPALSGCLSGDGILDVSGNRGIPGSLTLACLDDFKGIYMFALIANTDSKYTTSTN